MVAPSFFNQEIILPVSCAISRAGITTLIAISAAELPRCFEHRLLCWHSGVFQWRREGNGHVHRSDSFDRSFQVEERALGNDGCDFCSHAITPVPFVNDHG